MSGQPKSLDEAIDVVEEAYEFMLAYAAQGRRREEGDEGAGVRERLTKSVEALDVIAAALADKAGPLAGASQAGGDFLDLVRTDVLRARAAYRFVLAQSSIGSQIVDNLNATSYVRTLLTDLFLVDEALKISGL